MVCAFTKLDLSPELTLLFKIEGENDTVLQTFLTSAEVCVREISSTEIDLSGRVFKFPKSGT